MTQQDVDALVRAAQAIQHEPIPGTVGRQDALCRGWYPHPSPFKWPTPRTRAEYIQHPKKPSQFRITSTGRRFTPDSRLRCVGEDLLAAWRADAEEWRRRLVVADPVMRTTLPQKPAKPAQTDRLAPLLHGDPIKKGFKISHAPPAPINSQLAIPWTDPHAPQTTTTTNNNNSSSSTSNTGRGGGGGSGSGGKVDKAKLAALGNKDFRNTNAKPKIALHKLPYNQSWNASVHDKYYEGS
ncbi:hypothetical protein VOLCADRAFT_87751 [Volvox carteri f. nagariensis]|uniref:Uncharacterized protein n=1 Tax=Volvox carteri f. nagariensis TaxID=3068 RepID=D8TM55_VOLCA|nr:uncharacterized protein VOLCADRAFT_87751 [Volvox carteri f. nagariensis]EFJ51584.1 hypothetical protein VOLCADRAFT_87751 [Volvox carteri f. nagariensis]|eukprot:XP_002947536.1 hypothetical protein VOLCADRAFT_87751 [Volvox carteri f. nagariensis]